MNEEEIRKHIDAYTSNIHDLIASCYDLIMKSEDRNDSLLQSIKVMSETVINLEKCYSSHLESLTKNRDEMTHLLKDEIHSGEKRMQDMKLMYENMKMMYEAEIKILQDQANSYKNSYDTLLKLFDRFTSNIVNKSSSNVQIGDIASKNNIV